MATSVEARKEVDPVGVVVLGLLALVVVWLLKKSAEETSHYSMRIEWSAEDRLFIVSLPEWGPYAKTHGATYEEAVRAGHEVLRMLIANRRADARSLPPVPSAEVSQAA